MQIPDPDWDADVGSSVARVLGASSNIETICGLRHLAVDFGLPCNPHVEAQPPTDKYSF